MAPIDARDGDRDDGGPDASAPAAGDVADLGDVDDVGELIRLTTMLQTLLDEVRRVDLDEAARERLAAIQGQAVDAIEANLSSGLSRELVELAVPFSDGATPSESELRIAQAQLAGWLGGLFQGFQAAAMSRQLAQRAVRAPNAALDPSSEPAERSGGAYL